MGKAAKQRLDAKKRLLFASTGDDRSPEQRAQARAMLDALQKKLEDDALREDGFYFHDGAFVAARRPRTSSGMKVRSYDGHVQSVKALALVSFTSKADSSSRVTSAVVTFGLDRIGIYDFQSAKELAALDVSHCGARFICGAAVAVVTSAPTTPDTSTPPAIPVSSRALVRFAYATHTTPVVHSFNPLTSEISEAVNQDDAVSKQSPGFSGAHQQQIASIAFSPDASVLATCSWDSTCMLWEIHNVARANELPINADEVSNQHLSVLVPLTLVLVEILPVHELGASCVSFTSDGQQLVTTGDCLVKLWSVVPVPKQSTSSSIEKNDDMIQQEQDGDKTIAIGKDLASLSLARERLEWETAIPFAFSVQKSMDLLTFDDTLAELVPHHAWRDQRHARPNGERVLTLELPLEAQRKHSTPDIDAATDTSTASQVSDKVELPEQWEALPDDELPLKSTPILSSNTEVQVTQPLPSTSDNQSVPEDNHVDSVELHVDTDESSASARGADSLSKDTSSSSNCQDLGSKSETTLTTPSPETCTSSAECTSSLSLEDAAFLTQYYRDLAMFDFEQLLNPTVPLRSGTMATTIASVSSSVEALSLNDDDGSSVEPSEEAASPRKNPLPLLSSDKTISKHLEWRPLLPDANGKLLTTFHDHDVRGVYSAHTSRITSCAVAADRDVVVTVSLDKALKFWSLSTARVLESVIEAHAAPITCCAVSAATTRQNPSADGMLVATGAKDNVVKVWRRASSAPPVECIYTLSGHYDGLTACAFDPTGVFLVTASDDTTVITWRVVPSSPDQPSPLTVVAIDKFAITLSWDVPLANGSPLLQYVIRTKQVSSLGVGGHDMRDVPDAEVPAKYTSKTVEELQPGVQYTFEIAAVNAIGSSLFSAATGAIETLAFVPSRIEQPLQYSDSAATHIRLSWKQPSPNGAHIESITIRCLPENSAFVPVLEVSVPVSELELIVTAPRDDTVARTGTKHARLPVRAKRSTAVAKATKAKAKPSKSAEAIIKDVTQAALAPLSPPADAFYAFVVNGLWPGEIYQFVAAAANRCGLGAFSRVSDYVKMDSTAPDPPTAPRIVKVDKRHVDIAWDQPKSNGSAIVQYTLEWIQDTSVLAVPSDTPIETSLPELPDGDSAKRAGDVDAPASPRSRSRNSVVLLTRSIPGTFYTLEGLEPGQPLRVWLSASNVIANKLCTSALSPASDIATTLCDVPDTPAQPTLVLSLTPADSAHSLVLTFTPPKANGLAIERYDALLFADDVQFGVTNRQVARAFTFSADDCSPIDGLRCAFSIEKLRGKTLYSVQLCAINALGASAMSEVSPLVSTTAPTVPARLLVPPALVGAVEPTKASIAWSAPKHDGGAPLTAFIVQYSMQPTTTVLGDDDADDDVDDGDPSARRYKALFEHEVTVYHGCELVATFLKPKTTYRFRVASSNAVGRSPFSKKSASVATPSLVGYTIAQYFADRPLIEHTKARFIQKRYRVWKLARVQRRRDHAALCLAVHGWHVL